MTSGSSDSVYREAEPGTERKACLIRNGRVQGLVGLGVAAGFAIGLLVSGMPWHLPPAWGDIPTWISAVATIGLLVGAIITARYAIKAFREQAREVAILVAENNRQAAERRRAQAASVYIGLPVRGIRVVQPSAQNASGLPVFDAQFWYTGPDGLSGPHDLGMIMPGPVGINGQQMRYEEAVQRAILTFRDAEGISWIRMADGTLQEQTGLTARESILAALGEPGRGLAVSFMPV